MKNELFKNVKIAIIDKFNEIEKKDIYSYIVKEYNHISKILSSTPKILKTILYHGQRFTRVLFKRLKSFVLENMKELYNIICDQIEKKTSLLPHFSKGNSKLGKMLTWSTLNTNRERFIAELGFNVKGTCSETACKYCEKSCYVNKSYRYPSVLLHHAINTLWLNNLNDLYYHLDIQIKQLYEHNDIRFNQSGELQNTEQYRTFYNLLKNNKMHSGYIYTKMYDCVTSDLKAGLVPYNFVTLISVWNDQGIKEYNELKDIENVKAFVYMKKGKPNRNVKIDVMCPAYDINGKMSDNEKHKCVNCRYCIDYNNGIKVIGCWDHK